MAWAVGCCFARVEKHILFCNSFAASVLRKVLVAEGYHFTIIGCASIQNTFRGIYDGIATPALVAGPP